jgi:ribosome biogenesis GTPase
MGDGSDDDRRLETVARADDPALARVVAGFGRHFLIDAQGELLVATRRGKRGDVVVGDLVRFERGGPSQATIESVAPRATLLFRADQTRSKSLAANIDQAVIVYASQPAFNVRFIWRALVAAHHAGIASLVVLNKIDLPDTAAALSRLEQLRRMAYPTLTVSALHGASETRAALAPLFAGRNSLLIGQSGMGKSTLLNAMAPGAGARTREFSQRLNLGKQTTTVSRWFTLPGGGALIDTPGFQSFGLAQLDADAIDRAFPDFAPWLGKCRFLNCRHDAEPGCAIRAAVDSGAIDAQRLAFHRELLGRAP